MNGPEFQFDDTKQAARVVKERFVNLTDVALHEQIRALQGGADAAQREAHRLQRLADRARKELKRRKRNARKPACG